MNELTNPQKEALAIFAKKNGRTWKSKLNTLWMNGRDDREFMGHALRQVRNSIGPSGLLKLKKEDLVQVYNNTTFNSQTIESMPVLGTTVNKWRGRNVVLRQHPIVEDMVVSVGTTFDGGMVVISAENKSDWATALDYAAYGKVYVSE